MNLSFSDKQLALQARLAAFMDEHVYPAEALYHEQLADGESRWQLPAVMETLKARAREADLWNLFLPDSVSQFKAWVELNKRICPIATGSLQNY